ncbi:hypothetical protein KC878_02175 [Candidatus Saccharibacteria bacterium]|nr:hypothetical protein [Candidatus Saccharibacteria bacterium]MCB9820996.1 hypothetical protein [Candidatus Nomurabacteria bacterium]
MKQKLLILGRSNLKTKNDPELIGEAFSEHMEVDTADYTDLRFMISNEHTLVQTKNGVDLKDYNLILFFGWYANAGGVYYKDLAYAAALYANSKGVSCWNSEVLHQRSTTKLSAMMKLAINGVKIPKTWFSVDKEWLATQMNADGASDYVYKAAATSRGNDNFLINPTDSLAKTTSNRMMLLQEYVPNNHDLRLICADFKPIMIIRRSSNNQGHLNNTSQGGLAEVISINEIDQDTLDMAESAARILEREMGGVDLVYAEKYKAYICLEVNPVPQLTSGAYIEEKLNRLRQSVKDSIEKGSI